MKTLILALALVVAPAPAAFAPALVETPERSPVEPVELAPFGGAAPERVAALLILSAARAGAIGAE